jgi:hypothetical protein
MYGDNETSLTAMCFNCDQNCSTCNINATYCLTCQLENVWYNFVCYSNCPISTYLPVKSQLCLICNNLCISCSGSDTNCSNCTLNGANMAYLLNFTCYHSCPDFYYSTTIINIGTTNVCYSCDVGCVKCTSHPAHCTQCAKNYYFYEVDTTCLTKCPNLYFEDTVTDKCLLCSIYCVNATM